MPKLVIEEKVFNDLIAGVSFVYCPHNFRLSEPRNCSGKSQQGCFDCFMAATGAKTMAEGGIIDKDLFQEEMYKVRKQISQVSQHMDETLRGRTVAVQNCCVLSQEQVDALHGKFQPLMEALRKAGHINE